MRDFLYRPPFDAEASPQNNDEQAAPHPDDYFSCPACFCTERPEPDCRCSCHS